MDQKRIQDTIEKAENAFWAVVANEFKEAKSGDLDIYSSICFTQQCEKIVKDWLCANVDDSERVICFKCGNTTDKWQNIEYEKGLFADFCNTCLI
jgi:hypothetical protein